MRVEDEKTKAMDGAISRRKILLGGTTLAAATAMGSAAPLNASAAAASCSRGHRTSVRSDR